MIQIDIDMPKSCFECDKTYKWKKDGEVQCPHINMPSISTNRDCRPPYCPLKEVPDNDEIKYAPKADVVERSKIDKAIEEIEKSMESIIGRYNSSVPERDRPMQKIARNEGRLQALDILKKHIGEVTE